MRFRSNKFVLVAFVCAISLITSCSNSKNDAALATQIKSMMFSDSRVKAANITVAVKDGEVTLTGDVPDDAARYQAFKLANDTPGVKHVVDKMVVESAALPPPADVSPSGPVTPPQVSRHPVKPRRHRAPERDSNLSAKELDPPVAPPPAPAATAPQPEAAPAPPPPPQPRHVEILEGTSVRVQMIDGVDSAVNRAGEMFHASLASPIIVDDQMVVPAGTNMYVRLVNSKSAGHLSGQSQLALELVRMDYQGKTYTLVSNDYQQTGSSRGKRTAETVGGGAALGALLGAVIGHGKGAAIGSVTGAGAGTVAQEATKPQQVQIPSETKLDFLLQQPLEVTYFPGQEWGSLVTSLIQKLPAVAWNGNGKIP